MSVVNTIHKMLVETYRQNRRCLMTYMWCYKQLYHNNHIKDVWPLIWGKVCTPVFMSLLQRTSSAMLQLRISKEQQEGEKRKWWEVWLEDTVNKK